MVSLNMVLAQERLDVAIKKRSNLFNWRGQFTPEFVEYILQTFTKPGDKILDPFSGSGTVLQESAKLELMATGFEINPSAYAMSKFFTFCNMPFAERHIFHEAFEAKLKSQLLNLNGQKVYIDKLDYRESYSNLLNFGIRFNDLIQDKQERIFLLNILFQSERDKTLTVKDSIYKSFLFTKKALFSLPYSEQSINAHLKDAKSVGCELEGEIDFLLTSPPYINVFNYHQNYRAIIETFKFDILKVAHSEFGSNRKNRGNRFKTVIQYCIDMEIALNSFWKALKQNGKMVLVLGRESNVRGIPFYNGQLIIEILEKSCGFSNIRTLERKFTNKFGISIKEDIIIAEKISHSILNFNHGKSIALKHLENSLTKSKDEITFDIIDAIKTIDLIQPSPLFNPTNILVND
ncbi:MAG TPA: DNA methyltransferase [Mucilaginibacter sp.]